ncbi:MAG: class II fructose-bisphosphate aldolase [Anaerolineales bacterium]|jgi:fructose/tagatose bisphosphate aldolase
MSTNDLQGLLNLFNGSVQFENGQINIVDESQLRKKIYRLAEVSVLEKREKQALARFLIRKISHAIGIIPASIHDLYIARGRGDVPANFTVPAINLRALSFNAARSVFRVANSMNAGAFIFEIARSEMGYSDQRPAEYITNILAAAISENYIGPIFIQGDHFQVSAKRYSDNPDTEVQAVEDLIEESIAAGFYNIDVDTSTLVDLDKESVREQQTLNTQLSAMFTSFIRDLEPEGITVSVGGEIGEVGGRNSTEEELRVYMDGFNDELRKIDPGAIGLSKISIQTGTSHGGVVLPDGSIAKVSVDFDTMLRLSRIARNEYSLAGAVQHGASTLPEDAFGKFVESEACEVHLATNFQNMFYDLIPDELRKEMYNYLDDNHAHERKEGQTDEQFYYKTRKRALGPFKSDAWNLNQSVKQKIEGVWETQFSKLFTLLGMKDTRQFVDDFITPIVVEPTMEQFLLQKVEAEDTSNLAD